VLNFLNPLYVAVAWVMQQIHSGLSTFLNPNGGLTWVLTIVLLVVLMRLLLVPLFVKQMHAMRKMSALTPQLQELRKKYKNDKQTLNEETMRLYKEAGVNPLGGCLPLLAQMPMFFALFSVLRGIADWKSGPTPYGMTESFIKSAQNANILGAHISDKVLFTHGMNVPLHAKIVILGAVAISVVTTFLTVRQSTKRGMTPQMTPDNPMAASQKYMAYIVPFFALSGLYWAFGLVLYWVTTNVWTLGQQYVLFKRYPPTAAADAAAGTGSSPAASARPATAPRLVSGPKAVGSAKQVSAAKPVANRPTPAKPAADGKASGTKPAARPAGGKPAAKPAAGAAKQRQAAYNEAARQEAADMEDPQTAKPGAARPAAAKSGAARPAAAKPAKPAATGAKPAATRPAPAKPSASSGQQSKRAPGRPAASGTGQGKAQAKSGGQQSDGNGSGSVSGILRRFGKGRTETEEQPAEPEPKLVRQQRVRQSRSKRSGKR
jgi:YidC/Oxa1 family membrane protein insertase